MSLWKNRPKCSPFFIKINRDVEGSVPKLLGSLKTKIFYSTFEKRSSPVQRWRCRCKFRSRKMGSWIQSYDRGSAQSKQSSNGRKFAQSCHPRAYIFLCKSRWKWKGPSAKKIWSPFYNGMLNKCHLHRNCCREAPMQGGQMSLVKYHPKCSPTHFLSKLMHNFLPQK
jgi:hypothetical protein